MDVGKGIVRLVRELFSGYLEVPFMGNALTR